MPLISSTNVELASQEYNSDPQFRKFRRQLFHTSLAHILDSLRPHMTTPILTRCGDGHYRRVIYGLGPYIADYPEQALLACIVQGWCPKYIICFQDSVCSWTYIFIDVPRLQMTLTIQVEAVVHIGIPIFCLRDVH